MVAGWCPRLKLSRKWCQSARLVGGWWRGPAVYVGVSEVRDYRRQYLSLYSVVFNTPTVSHWDAVWTIRIESVLGINLSMGEFKVVVLFCRTLYLLYFHDIKHDWSQTISFFVPFRGKIRHRLNISVQSQSTAYKVKMPETFLLVNVSYRAHRWADLGGQHYSYSWSIQNSVHDPEN